MKPMIINRAQAREHHAALVEARGESVITEQLAQIEYRAFDENPFQLRDVWKTEVPSVGREDRAARIGIDGPRARFQLTIEELVERAIRLGRVRKLPGIDFVAGDERRDFAAARRSIHAFAVPAREGGTFYQRVQRELAEPIAVGPAEKTVAVNLFGLDAPAVA